MHIEFADIYTRRCVAVVEREQQLNDHWHAGGILHLYTFKKGVDMLRARLPGWCETLQLFIACFAFRTVLDTVQRLT